MKNFIYRQEYSFCLHLMLAILVTIDKLCLTIGCTSRSSKRVDEGECFLCIPMKKEKFLCQQ